MTKMTTAVAKRIIPGAAAVIRLVSKSSSSSTPPTFCVIRRGNQPYRGCWALPGGKLELGETLLQCAQRELMEETQISTAMQERTLRWHSPGSFMVYDSIDVNDETNELEFHYIIAQCFALATEKVELIASDDALEAKWMTMDEIKVLSDEKNTTPGLVQILERSEELHSKGLLETS